MTGTSVYSSSDSLDKAFDLPAVLTLLADTFIQTQFFTGADPTHGTVRPLAPGTLHPAGRASGLLAAGAPPLLGGPSKSSRVVADQTSSVCLTLVLPRSNTSIRPLPCVERHLLLTSLTPAWR